MNKITQILADPFIQKSIEKGYTLKIILAMSALFAKYIYTRGYLFWRFVIKYFGQRYEAKFGLTKANRFVLHFPYLKKIELKNNDFDSSRRIFLIRLASREIELANEMFESVFEDQEDLFALHRFGWLLTGLSRYPSRRFVVQSLKVIDHWVKNYPMYRNLQTGIEESYSISERILNIPYFLSKIEEKTLVKYVDVQSLKSLLMNNANLLVQNLEYHGKYTNNHILNNARALYIVGVNSGSRSFCNVATKLIYQYYDRMFINGTLQEASSHYQVLLTRSYLEVYVAAYFKKDHEMRLFLQQRLSLQLGVTNLLQSKYSSKYPLFGDISPDFVPDWLMGYPFSSQKERISRWESVFELGDISDIGLGHMLNKTDCFYRKVEKGLIEFWCIVKTNANFPHSHNDNGSFVVFYNGNDHIIDSGLVDYRNGAVQINQKSYSSHSFLLPQEILDSEICPTSRFHFFQLYNCFRFNQIVETDDSIKFLVTSKKCSQHFALEFKASDSKIFMDAYGDSTFTLNLILRSEMLPFDLVINGETLFYADHVLTGGEYANVSEKYGEIRQRMVVGKKFRNRQISLS